MQPFSKVTNKPIPSEVVADTSPICFVLALTMRSFGRRDLLSSQYNLAWGPNPTLEQIPEAHTSTMLLDGKPPLCRMSKLIGSSFHVISHFHSISLSCWTQTFTKRSLLAASARFIMVSTSSSLACFAFSVQQICHGSSPVFVESKSIIEISYRCFKYRPCQPRPRPGISSDKGGVVT